MLERSSPSPAPALPERLTVPVTVAGQTFILDRAAAVAVRNQIDAARLTCSGPFVVPQPGALILELGDSHVVRPVTARTLLRLAAQCLEAALEMPECAPSPLPERP